MSVKIENFREIIKELGEKVTLIAVSKLRTAEEINILYSLGHRDFGENYVQELVAKQPQLPGDIRWHFIGHLQTNKVKYIAPFVHLIHGVDSYKLLTEINKQAVLNNRIIKCMLQVHIATEETKYGLSDDELNVIIESLSTLNSSTNLPNVAVCGLMGMASLTDDINEVRGEFKHLYFLLDNASAKTKQPGFKELSMGMSADYKIAVEEGSTMVRIGSLLFGERPAR